MFKPADVFSWVKKNCMNLWLKLVKPEVNQRDNGVEGI